MDNKAIRKQARHLYWKNRRLLWGLFLLYVFINLPWLLIKRYYFQTGMLTTSIGLAISIVISPIIYFGYFYVFYSIVQNKSAKTSMIFTMFKTPYNILMLYSYIFVLNIPFIILNFLIYLTSPFQYTALAGLLVFLVYILFTLVMSWLETRLVLTNYLLFLKPTDNIWKHAKTSFHLMKHKVGRYIGFAITVLIPIIIVYAIIFIVYTATSLSFYAHQTSFPYLSLTLYCVNVLILPYCSIAITGFSLRLIDEDTASLVSKNSRRKQARIESLMQGDTDV